MKNYPVSLLSSCQQTLFALGSAGFTMLERLIILYVPFYFLPPAEYEVHELIPDRTFLGFVTVLGIALVAGRVFDALADPLIAWLSDNTRSYLGRRKIFLLLSGLPLSVFTVLVFYPPLLECEALVNGVWLGVMICFFYISFTAYVNPYLALIADLGHSDEIRINLSTRVAFLGLLGMVVITVLFPDIVTRLQEAGMEMRISYRLAVLIFSVVSVLLLYASALGFNEKIHCLPRSPQRIGVIQSLKTTFSHRPFRIFIAGEMFLQLAMNMITMGMMYYAVVVFLRGQGFMTILACIIIGTALLCFPVVNFAARKYGKKKMLILGVATFSFCSMILFILSFNMSGIFFYLGLLVLAMAGLPLAVLTILINPTIAEMARAHAEETGQHQEAMFFGARAIPLKVTIALTGALFGFLLAAFGKDISQPLGVQLSILIASLACMGALLFFCLYPEEDVKDVLPSDRDLVGKN